jgi:hypothetical protein
MRGGVVVVRVMSERTLGGVRYSTARAMVSEVAGGRSDQTCTKERVGIGFGLDVLLAVRCSVKGTSALIEGC